MNLKYERLKYKLLGFNDHQIYEIMFGLMFGLNKEQVSLYAKKQFDYGQMWEIREGIKQGLNKEKILLFADPRFDRHQMRRIRFGLEDGLTLKSIQLFADEKFSPEQMDSIRLGIKDELSIEQIMSYADARFTPEQMDNMRRRFYLENNLPEEEKEQLNSTDFWVVTFSKLTSNPEEFEEKIRIVNKEVVEEIRKTIQDEILENEKNGNFEPLDLYAAVFDHFVDYKLIQQKRIYSYEKIEKNQENFRNLEIELNKSRQTAKNESLAHEEEEGMEKKQTDESKLAFMNITEKQILKTITKESKNTPGKTYNMCLIILSHGDFKGKAMWVFENQIKKHKTQHRAAEGVITWYVSLPINKPIKLFQYEKEADSDKHIIASTITIEDIEAFTENIKSAKTLEHEKYTQSLKEQQKHFDEQLEQIEDLER